MFLQRLATTAHPGIMNHNVMLRSDWHGECHCELVTERETEREVGGWWGNNDDDDDDDEGP